MKTFIIIGLALIAAVCAYEVEDIPTFMKERLDKYVQLTQEWEAKWRSMTKEDQEFFEKMIYDRLSHIPDSVKSRIHSRISEMESEDREKLRDYLLERFPEIKESLVAEDIVEQMNEIIEKLPIVLREKISDFISIRFAPAKAYENIDDADFIDFPDIPELIEVPEQAEGVPYSEDGLDEETRQKIDSFLLQREDWKRRWENLPEEKREAFEAYVKSKLNK